MNKSRDHFIHDSIWCFGATGDTYFGISNDPGQGILREINESSGITLGRLDQKWNHFNQSCSLTSGMDQWLTGLLRQ